MLALVTMQALGLGANDGPWTPNQKNHGATGVTRVCTPFGATACGVVPTWEDRNRFPLGGLREREKNKTLGVDPRP